MKENFLKLMDKIAVDYVKFYYLLSSDEDTVDESVRLFLALIFSTFGFLLNCIFIVLFEPPSNITAGLIYILLYIAFYILARKYMRLRGEKVIQDHNTEKNKRQINYAFLAFIVGVINLLVGGGMIVHFMNGGLW